jgi:hypothetical protein
MAKPHRFAVIGPSCPSPQFSSPKCEALGCRVMATLQLDVGFKVEAPNLVH